MMMGVIRRMPKNAGFRRGVASKDVESALAPEKRPKRNSWVSKLKVMGYPMESRYYAHRLDINKPMPAGSNSSSKVIWLCWEKTIQLNPELSGKFEGAAVRETESA